MFVLVNTVALFFICYSYLRMIHEIRSSGVACRSTQKSQQRDKVTQRFGIIILTDCLCWVPVIVVKLAALSGFLFFPSIFFNLFFFYRIGNPKNFVRLARNSSPSDKFSPQSSLIYLNNDHI